MSDEHGAELARLDQIVVESDARATPQAEWRAASATYDKAEVLLDRDGEEAALPCFEEVIRRLDHRTEAGPRMLLISAEIAVAKVHRTRGRRDESRAVLEAMVSRHLEDAPVGAAVPLTDATVLFAGHLHDEGERERASNLLKRLIDRYGRKDVPDRRYATAAARTWLANFLRDAGDLDAAIEQQDLAIAAIGDPDDDPYLRQLLARALVGKAYLIGAKGMLDSRDALCREVLRRFSRDRGPETVEHVKWARATLEDYSVTPRRQARWRR